LELDEKEVLWAYYPFKNRQTCAKTCVERNDPVGGKKWDMYEVISLYFPEVHTTSYETAVRLCREIGNRPETDVESRFKMLRNAVLSFSVRHVMDERNAAQVTILIIYNINNIFVT